MPDVWRRFRLPVAAHIELGIQLAERIEDLLLREFPGFVGGAQYIYLDAFLATLLVAIRRCACPMSRTSMMFHITFIGSLCAICPESVHPM